MALIPVIQYRLPSSAAVKSESLGRPPGVVESEEAETQAHGHGLAIVEFGVRGPGRVEDVGWAGRRGVREDGVEGGEVGGGWVPPICYVAAG